VIFSDGGSTENDFAISPNGRLVAVPSGKNIELVDINSGNKLLKLIGHQENVISVAFSPDSNMLVSGSGDNEVKDTTVRLWDVRSSRQLFALTGDNYKFSDVIADLAGSTLASTDSFIIRGNDEGSTKALKLWDLIGERGLTTLVGHDRLINATSFSPDGKILASGAEASPNGAGLIKLWDVESGTLICDLRGSNSDVLSLAFDARGEILASGGDKTITLWDVATQRELRTISAHDGQVGNLVFSPDNKVLASGSRDDKVKLWNVIDGREIRVIDCDSRVTDIAFSYDGSMLAVGTRNNTITIWDLAAGRLLRKFIGSEESDTGVSVSFSDNSKLIASDDEAIIKVWEIDTGKELEGLDRSLFSTVQTMASMVPGIYRKSYQDPLIANDQLQAKIVGIAKIRLLDVKSGNELLTLSALGEDDWAVVSPQGRFDTSRLEGPSGLHWLLPGAPFTPLSFEIFMRDYYEPKLLPRLIKCSKAGNCDREFKPVRDLTSINRTQPRTAITKITPTALRETVEVSVDVNSVISEDQRAGRGRQVTSGVYDLRLFRDGQLVGYSTSDEKVQSTFRTYKNFDDELGVWREADRVDLVDGKRTFTFTVKLPRNSQAKGVEFSAYAFNEDRVKSETARLRWSPPETATPSATEPGVKPRAYVLAVGVNANENPVFDLQFAANDARRFQEVLPQRLAATGDYSEVVPVSLISDWEMQRGQKVATKRDATKANFKAVLDLLAGRSVPDEIKRAIPNAEKLARTTPDDLVLILFSSHGYADQSGNFYFIPYDTGPGACSVFTDTVRQRSISSDELSLWLRDVDAGQMTLIVDACYSTAAIEGSGFKPGPMGSRGLGQLAYDKRMRILTATQADNVAMELPATADGRPIKHGLLSYALLEDGLGQNLADFKPQDKTIFMDEWLEYAVSDVPKLLVNQPQPINESRAQSKQPRDRPRLVLLKRELTDPGVCGPGPNAGPSRSQGQQPSLFDFTRRKREVPLVRNP
jgi:WD40 repeat protein